MRLVSIGYYVHHSYHREYGDATTVAAHLRLSHKCRARVLDNRGNFEVIASHPACRTQRQMESFVRSLK